MRGKVIYQSNTALGGESWRVTSDGVTARIQSRDLNAGAKNYRTRRAISHAEYAEAAEAEGLDLAYNDNPAILARLARAEAL